MATLNLFSADFIYLSKVLLNEILILMGGCKVSEIIGFVY